MSSSTTPISGTFAIPAPDAEILAEAETSGLEDIVDWDKLEERLLAGLFPSRKEVKEYVQTYFDAYNARQPEGTEPVVLTRNTYEAVIEGLCNLPADAEKTTINPLQWDALDARAAYEILPDRGVLSPANVREIRRRHEEEGESYTALGLAFGVNRTSIADIVNRVSWKDVA